MSSFSQNIPPAHKRFCLTLLVFFSSLILRSIWLDSLPYNLNPDEADNLTTYLLAKHTNNPSLLGFNWNGAPAINIYLIGFFWELFGKSFFGLRFLSALLSSLSILVFFVLSRKVTKNPALAFIFSLSLATNPWFLNFSRSGWENVFNALTLMIIFLGFYFLYLKQSFKMALFLLILGSVASFYFYHPGKLFFPAVVLILLIIPNLKKLKAHLFTFFLFFLISFLLILPQLKSMLTQPVKSFDRLQAVSIWKKPNSSQLFKNNLKRNLDGFLFFKRASFIDHLNLRYIPLNSNPLQPFLIPFYLTGLGVASIKYPYLLIFYLIVLLPVQIFSLDTPNAARAVHVVGAIYFFTLLGANFLLRKLSSLKPLSCQSVFFIFIFLTLIISLSDAKIYYQWISSAQTLKAREPAIWKNEYQAWLLTLEESIKSQGVGFNVSEWKEKKFFKNDSQ